MLGTPKPGTPSWWRAASPTAIAWSGISAATRPWRRVDREGRRDAAVGGFDGACMRAFARTGATPRHGVDPRGDWGIAALGVGMVAVGLTMPRLGEGQV